MTIAGVTITNPHRILYPEQGVTKAALAGYYEQVADWILPHVVDRPLALVRCPSGRAKPCFYQKHLDRGWPAEVEGIELEEKAGEKAVYIAIRDLPGLVALVQMGVLEIHPWGSRTDRPERPDRLVFDLDPGPDVAWPDVLEAAGRMREALADLELESFVRTTGGKGLHVVVPIARTIDWDEARSFAKAVAASVRDADPDRYLTQLSKARRKGKILIDWLRNGRNSTAVASYSTRARPGAPVAVNLAWDELASLRSSDAYTALNLPRRLAALDRDPWDGFFEARQAVKKSTWRRLEAASAR